jgi:hypothetical protein
VSTTIPANHRCRVGVDWSAGLLIGCVPPGGERCQGVPAAEVGADVAPVVPVVPVERRAVPEVGGADVVGAVEGDGAGPSVGAGAEDRSAVVVAAAVAGAVVGAEGVDVVGVADPSVSAPMVVPLVEAAPTRADTGFFPISSIPVTITMAMTKTATAETATRDQRTSRGFLGARRGSSEAGIRRAAGAPGGRPGTDGRPCSTRRRRSFVLRSDSV